MYKAIIYDFFGVFCTDVAPNWFMKQPGHDDKVDEFVKLCRMSDRNEINKIQFYGLVANMFDMDTATVRNQIEAETAINWDFVNFARSIKPRYKTAILSDGTNEWEMGLIDNGLRDIFDYVLLSGNIGMVKSEPEAYEYTLEILGATANETVFIDDRQSNIDIAEKCGIKSILFETNNRTIEQLKQLGIS